MLPSCLNSATECVSDQHCLLPPSPAAGDDVVAELLKEASMLGSLRHPNIVWVYGIVLPALSGGGQWL